MVQPASFDNEICSRPHVYYLKYKIWRPCWGVLRQTKRKARNQSTRCVTICMVMSQRVIEWISNLYLNVFCVGWHLALAVSHKYNFNSLVAVLDINKSNVASNSKRLYIPDVDGREKRSRLWQICHDCGWIFMIAGCCLVTSVHFSGQTTY